jgi:N6-L-threonylcarbamoyladenine synthase
MMVLGIETSCDDTGAAVFDGKKLHSNVVSTQLVHRDFGGIVPELASRSHIRLILPVIEQALKEAGVERMNLEGIAVTAGPGLAGSLLVGLCVAKGMSLSMGIPFIGVNHLEAHIWALRLSHPDIEPPFITLVASGGHTQLVRVLGWGRYEVLGRTRDDAAGEAYDKVGKLLGLGFPGGPVIEKMAAKGNPKAVPFPRALGSDTLDFSFSGLKTAVLNHTLSLSPEGLSAGLADITASFQAAVVDVLVRKTISAAVQCRLRCIGLAGGVAMNSVLRSRMTAEAGPLGIGVLWPDPPLCSDNAAMVACAGHHYLSSGLNSPWSLAPDPSLNL